MEKIFRASLVFNRRVFHYVIVAENEEEARKLFGDKCSGSCDHALIYEIKPSQPNIYYVTNCPRQWGKGIGDNIPDPLEKNHKDKFGGAK